MKLEYIHGGSEDCPLIRFYDFKPTEIARLRRMVQSLARGSLKSISLDECEGVKAICGCRLTLRSGSRDEGIHATETDHFECDVTSSKWGEIDGLLEPFSESKSTGFQWLDESGPISLLISHDGRW
jgi:hypothetical protein